MFPFDDVIMVSKGWLNSLFSLATKEILKLSMCEESIGNTMFMTS